MSGTDPVVSVIIPCFDSARFLADTLAAVMAQTYPDFEVVLVDDGSRDATPALIAQLIERYAGRRLRAYHQPNRGVAAARNAGIARAAGRYVLPLDADDLIDPSLLEVAVGVLERRPDIDVVYSDWREFGDLDVIRRAGPFRLDRLRYFNQLAYCALYRRSLWEDLGGYRSNVAGFDDWDLWIAAAAAGRRAHHHPEPLLWHRRRGDSQLADVLPRYEQLFATIIVNNRNAYSPTEVAQAERFLAGEPPSALLRSGAFLYRRGLEG